MEDIQYIFRKCISVEVMHWMIFVHLFSNWAWTNLHYGCQMLQTAAGSVDRVPDRKGNAGHCRQFSRDLFFQMQSVLTEPLKIKLLCEMLRPIHELIIFAVISDDCFKKGLVINWPCRVTFWCSSFNMWSHKTSFCSLFLVAYCTSSPNISIHNHRHPINVFGPMKAFYCCNNKVVQYAPFSRLFLDSPNKCKSCFFSLLSSNAAQSSPDCRAWSVKCQVRGMVWHWQHEVAEYYTQTWPSQTPYYT